MEEDRDESVSESMKAALIKFIEKIDETILTDDAVYGISTGFSELDYIIGGLKPGEVITVADTQGHSAVALCNTIAESIAIKNSRPIAYIAIGEQYDRVAASMVASLGRVDIMKLYNNHIYDEDWPRLTSAVGVLSVAPIYISSPARLTTHELSRLIKIHKETNDLDACVVHGLGMFAPSNQETFLPTFHENLMREIKSIAAEHEIAIVLSAKTNKKPLERPNKRPAIIDFAPSHAIYDLSDIVIFTYQDELYDDDSPDRGTVELIVAKNHTGPVGTVRAIYMDKFRRIDQLCIP